MMSHVTHLLTELLPPTALWETLVYYLKPNFCPESLSFMFNMIQIEQLERLSTGQKNNISMCEDK